MPAAEYTRETVDRIRRESVTRAAMHIARDLEWPLDRLRRVAHQHNIELANANPTVEDKSEAARNQLIAKPRVISFEIRQIIDGLPPRLARIMGILATAEPGKPMS